MGMLIELKNIVVYSGNYKVLKEVSLTIPEGKFSVIIGPSGCGKSTLLKVIAGILFPDQGELLFQGDNFHHMSEKSILAYKKRNGFVFQDSALWENKDIYENLALPLHFHFHELSRRKIDDKINAALTEINLIDSLHLRPAQLSTGEQKMVSFMRALITGPSLIFLDEPTSSIDLSMRRKILNILSIEKHKNATIIVVTHDNEILSQLTDFLIVLKDGILLQNGPKNEVMMSTYPEVREILTEITHGGPDENQTGLPS